jgi:hypothetical protein
MRKKKAGEGIQTHSPPRPEGNGELADDQINAWKNKAGHFANAPRF